MTEPEQENDDEAPAATVDEVFAASKGLTETQKLRLHFIADDFLTSMGEFGRTGEDLIQDALLQVLQGARIWRPARASFIKFLVGVMKSLASHTLESYKTEKRQEPIFESAMIQEREDGSLTSPLNDVPSSSAIDHELINREMDAEADTRLGIIYRHVEDDEQVADMVLHQVLGLKGPEIQSEMKLSAEEFKAVDKRRRRKLDQLRKKYYRNGK